MRHSLWECVFVFESISVTAESKSWLVSTANWLPPASFNRLWTSVVLVTLHSYPRFWEQHIFLLFLLDLFLLPQITWFWWVLFSVSAPCLRVGSWYWLSWPIRFFQQLYILKWEKRHFPLSSGFTRLRNTSPEIPTVLSPPWTGCLCAVEEIETKQRRTDL